jgi:hypothetical protein
MVDSHKCLECDKPAECVRHTQFAGNHPYCLEHAQRESDYGQDDSYTYWRKCPLGIEVAYVSAENDVGSSLRVGDARDL